MPINSPVVVVVSEVAALEGRLSFLFRGLQLQYSGIKTPHAGSALSGRQGYDFVVRCHVQCGARPRLSGRNKVTTLSSAVTLSAVSALCVRLEVTIINTMNTSGIPQLHLTRG